MTTTRHAAHVEEIRPGVAGLHLGEADPNGDGPAGYALMDEAGKIQYLPEDIDAGTFRQFAVDRTTGAYILPADSDL